MADGKSVHGKMLDLIFNSIIFELLHSEGI